MFARGNWSVFGVARDKQAAFVQSLDSWARMFYWSQLAASAVVRMSKVPAIGINPYDRPRLDEGEELTIAQVEAVAAFRSLDPDTLPQGTLFTSDPEGADTGKLYGLGAERFVIGQKRYGFWFVWNDWKDVGDQASKKEDLAYTSAQRPYKFLDKEAKIAVDVAADSASAMVRKQFPVMVDFSTGRVFAETTNKGQLGLLQDLLQSLGCEVFAMAWVFGRGGAWIPPLLKQLHADSRFKEAFGKRAGQEAVLGRGMAEKLEDREMEKIVSTTFSLTELETEEWIGLTTPAEIKLFPGADRVVASSPTSATLLMDASRESEIYSAVLIFQERVAVVSRKGEERTFRNDIFRLAVNDNINETEAGAGLLRSFELVGFKRKIAREARKSGHYPEIKRLWCYWMLGMEAAIDTFTAAANGILEPSDVARSGLVRLYPAEAEASDLVLHEFKPEVQSNAVYEAAL